MVDMNGEMYRCCGHTVEISGYCIELEDGIEGHRVFCALCGDAFSVPGEIEAARRAIPLHFLSEHGLQGDLEDWAPEPTADEAG